jgi:O-antigen ligase
VVHPIHQFLGVREAAQIAIGIVALAITAELVYRESLQQGAVAIVLGAVLPILAAGWQAIGPRIGASGALPLLDRLPAANGLEITRQALSSFGSVGARAKGTFGDPDHFGVYMILALGTALALTLFSLQREDRRAQISLAAMTAACAAALAATYSRSAWIGGALGTVLTLAWGFAAWRKGGLRLPGRRVMIAVIVGVLAVAAVEAPSVIERATPGSKINVVSDREHASTVRFAFRRFTAHPLLGIGPGGLGVELKLPPRTSGASSTYLSVAAQVGIFGLLFLLAAAAIAIGLRVRTYRSLEGRPSRALAVGLGAAYVGFMAANVTYDVWFDDFHWLVLGVVAGSFATLASSPANPDPSEDVRRVPLRGAHV